MSVEILCSICGVEAFLNREPVYEGFTKTGETLSCSACGGVFASEEDVPFKQKEVVPEIFTDADRSEKVEVFDEAENKRLLHKCFKLVSKQVTMSHRCFISIIQSNTIKSTNPNPYRL